MAFVKNDARINRTGRKKGVQNKTTNELRLFIQGFVENNLHTLQASFDKLEDKERLLFVERLLKHVLPAPVTELESLTDAQLDELINKLKGKDNDYCSEAQN